MAEEVRTVMYSVGVKGEVLVHRFPWNANKREGMQKLQKLVQRGFTFDDPRKGRGLSIPEVIITKVIDLEKPVSPELAEVKEVEEIPILCPECGKKCKTRWGLRVHQRVHKKR